jgi:hypothetical protein
MTCKIVDLPVPERLFNRLITPPLSPINLINGAPNAVNTANAWGSNPGMSYTFTIFFHDSKSPIGRSDAEIVDVALEGGLYLM